MTTYRRPEPDEITARTPLEQLLTWPVAGQPARSAWRLIAAAGAITESISHLPLIMGSLSETPWLGVGYLLLSVAGLLLAMLLVTGDTTAVWASTIVLATLALIGYILSRTTGLPQVSEYKGHWGYPLGVVSIVGEATMILTGLLHFVWAGRRPGV